MGDGKQSRGGQALRRQKIIDYIRKNGPVKGSVICRDLSMSRSSLSDDIRWINTSGEIIASPKRGVYCIGREDQKKLNPLAAIDRQSVRRWMILLSLFKKDRSSGEIKAYLEEAGISCSLSALSEDLRVLRELSLLERVTEGKRCLYHSESLYETDLREAAQFVQTKARGKSRVDIEACEAIGRKVRHCIPEMSEEIGEDGIQRRGKHNALTREQVQMLLDFEQYPFEERELTVTYRTNAGTSAVSRICVGIIVYVVETGRIYLIGEERQSGRAAPDAARLYTVIPMDRILSVRVGSRANTCYKSPQYHRICREMFQISTEEPMQVRVRFENYPFIRDKIERLCAARQTASYSIESSRSEIVYVDTVRGKGDLARYLRRFGRSAIVEEPQELRETMMESSRKILELYGAQGEDGWT